MMKPSAELLLIQGREIRFKSLINGRIFSFEKLRNGRYQFSELADYKMPYAWMEHVLYRGSDDLLVMFLIFIEVHALPSKKGPVNDVRN